MKYNALNKIHRLYCIVFNYQYISLFRDCSNIMSYFLWNFQTPPQISYFLILQSSLFNFLVHDSLGTLIRIISFSIPEIFYTRVYLGTNFLILQYSFFKSEYLGYQSFQNLQSQLHISINQVPRYKVFSFFSFHSLISASLYGQMNQVPKYLLGILCTQILEFFSFHSSISVAQFHYTAGTQVQQI